MKKQTDIALLLMILLLLSASIGILHGRKQPTDTNATANEARAILEYQDAIDYIQPYLISGNIDLVAATLLQIDDSLFERLLDAILADEIVRLNNDQKVQLLAAILAHDTEKQKIIFDRMHKQFAHFPLFVPLIPRYKNVVSLLKKAAEQMNLQDQFARWNNLSFDNAIEKNDVDIFHGLMESGIAIDAKKASLLLFRIASENKSSAFVPILIQMKANVHYSPDGKQTALIKAAQANNIPMVKALMQQGALPDQVLDSKVGSARQIAFERDHAALELILKNIPD